MRQCNEQREYENSLKVYRDLKNSLDTALEQGLEKGLQQGREEGLQQGLQQGREECRKGVKLEIAKSLLSSGMDVQTVAKLTGLSKEEIENKFSGK